MKWPILFCFLLITLVGQSQNSKIRLTNFGFKAGIAYTAMNFNKGVPPPSAPVLLQWKPGISINALLKVQLTERVSLQPEYGFLIASSTRTDSATDYRLSYLSFPFLLKLQLIADLHIMGGAQFDILLSARNTKAGITTTITHDTEERNIGITGGLEYLFSNRLGISVRYTQGLNHVGIGQRSSVQEYKSQQALLTAGFYF